VLKDKMKIISFLNSKGGVGKTTLAINLAKYLYLYNYSKIDDIKPRILLVDADPQGSVRDWQEAGSQNAIDVIAADRKQTLSSLPSLLGKSDYDYVLIDTPGKVTDIMAAAVAISDVCLIPVCPSPYDLWASNDVAEIVEVRRALANDKPECYYVMNRCIPKTKISKEVIEYLNTRPFTILGKPITQRVVYAQSATEGGTIYDTDNEGARDDMHALGNALIHCFDYAETSDEI
jgi:chromosome partitioning protein